MSRVALLDSADLDLELQNQLWSQFQSKIKPSNFIDELQLVLHSLIYLLSTKKNNQRIVTYGSMLSGISYNTNKTNLYIVMVLTKYLGKKLSSHVFALNSKIIIQCFKLLFKTYKLLDLINFINLLTHRKDLIYTSLWHRLFNITCTYSFSENDFYKDAMYANMEFQSKQMILNNLLELLNADSLAPWLIKKFINKPSIRKNTNKNKCYICDELPINPYSISCCNTRFCYTCALQCLEWNICNQCGSSTEFSMNPVYQRNNISDEER